MVTLSLQLFNIGRVLMRAGEVDWVEDAVVEHFVSSQLPARGSMRNNLLILGIAVAFFGILR